MDFSCFILEVISPIEDIKPELWETYNLKPISVDTLGDRTWRERNININNAEIACYLEEKAVNIIIATDGSIRDNITAGGGIGCPKKTLFGVELSTIGVWFLLGRLFNV